MNAFPSPYPPEKAWQIVDPSFSPRAVWKEDATIIKETAGRKVIRAGEFFIKAFRLPPGPLGRLRDPAIREWIISRALAVKNITPKPCACGRSGRWSYFVARRAHGVDLEQYLDELVTSRDRKGMRKLIQTFCSFLLDIASCGVMQPDFHLGNIFFQQEPHGLLLLDLHRARLKSRPLNQQEFLEQLLFVLPPFMERLAARNILEACSLLSTHAPALKNRRERYHLLDRAFRNMRRHWDRKETRKIYLGQLKKGSSGGLFISAPSLETRVSSKFHAMVNNPAKYLWDGKTVREVLKDSRHTLCLRVIIDEISFFLKAYRSSGHLKSLSYLARKPRSLRTWELSWRLAYRHIPVVTPIAVIQARNPWRQIYGAVLFPWTDRAASTVPEIRKILREPGSSHPFIRSLASFVWQMHQRGVFHGDCKITNFVYRPGGKPELSIFDLDSTRILKNVGERERISDISCMCRSLEKLAGTGAPASLFMKEYARFHVPWDDRREKIKKSITRQIMRKEKRAG